tara:strand:+ start:241 stop:612 length:372 start_codon:yes stop_codon:yes gene_type:complete
MDTDTLEVFSPTGRLMKPHVDGRKRVCTKIMMKTGKQRMIVIKDMARKVRDQEANPLEKQQLRLENELKMEFLISQISTYHNILLNQKELSECESSDDKHQYLIDLGLGLDMSLATTVLQLIK